MEERTESFVVRVWIEHEPRALGCSAIKWVSTHELGAYDFPAADARLLKTLRETPNLWKGT